MKHDVLVVGAGPVGLTMAAELARFGVSVRIIDKSAARTDKSKALVLWSRTLELIDRMGCGESFINAGFKATSAHIIAGKKTITDLNLDGIDSPHPYALMLPQSETERLMEEHLGGLGVAVERQVELLRFTQADDKVAATLHHVDGTDETIDVKWMIGCDGAHSAVRHGLGVKFEGDTQPSDWILGDVHLDVPKGTPEGINIYWHADGALIVIPIVPGRYRVIADVGDAKENAHRADPALEEIQAVLDRRGPGGIRVFDPVWLAAFRINERKVADYRAGRVFLAGDAAHVHSPAGGQGMNTGMQDACNLAWKLALVNRGLAAPEPLLQSYSGERSAVGEQVLSDAGRLTMLAILRGGVSQAIRNHAAALIFGIPAVRGIMANKITELAIGYPKSPLTVPAHCHHPTPGQRAPIAGTNNPVGAGTTPRFALFANADEEATVLTSRHREILEPQLRAPFADGGIWLVRPDGYVAMHARSGEWGDVEKYLRDVVGER